MADVKSYFLLGLTDEQSARKELSKVLPGQIDPWLLFAQAGDPIAYFEVTRDFDGDSSLCIQADISGRHFNEDSAVLSVLRELQLQLGGTVHDDV